MKKLPNVTLFGLDCVNIERLVLAAEICKKDFEFAETKLLTSLPHSDKNIIPVAHIDSIRKYSEFMLKEAGGYIDTDFVLIAQHDGFILNPDAWTDEFLEYDYIGAPFWENEEFIVGNGGFSLRSKKLHDLLQSDPFIQIEETPSHKYSLNEDWIICVMKREYLESKGIRFAPVELALRFSFESNKKLGKVWNGQFGFHGLKWTDISPWLKEHPEYNIENKLRE